MNIDKDIEKVNKLWYLLDDVYSTGLIENEERDEYQNAIDNVLKELGTYKRIANMKLDDREEIINNLCEHRCIVKTHYEEELETYKKIAEKLAEKLVEIEDGCKHIPTEICNKYSNGRCKQCIIDWARKEVENE